MRPAIDDQNWRAACKGVSMAALAPSMFARPILALCWLTLVVQGIVAQSGNTLPPGQGGTPPSGALEWPPRVPGTQASPWAQRGQQSGLYQPGFPRSGFPGVEPTAPEFRGFPIYNTKQPGFGGYPGFPGFTAPSQLPEGFLPPSGTLRPPGLWPSWLDLGSADTIPARFDRAMVVRMSERVWYRPADEAVYVPLPFYDKLREAEAGAGVQMRTMSGELNVIFHDGASLRGHGRAHLEVRSLSEAVAEIELLDLHRFWLRAKRRAVRVRLPDTSSLEVVDAYVYLARDGERVTVRCYGPSPVKLTSPLGTVDIERNRQVLLLMSPVPQERASTTLTLGGTVRARAEGRVLAVEGGSDGGAVDWLGARLQLGINQNATIDALAGATFPDNRPANLPPNATGQAIAPAPIEPGRGVANGR